MGLKLLLLTMKADAQVLRRPLLWLLLLLAANGANSVVSPKHRNKQNPENPQPAAAAVSSTSAPLSKPDYIAPEEIVFFETPACNTPQGEPGDCVPLSECPRLLQAVKDNSNDPEVKRFLVDSVCGNGYDEVCCGYFARVPTLTDLITSRPHGFHISRHSHRGTTPAPSRIRKTTIRTTKTTTSPTVATTRKTSTSAARTPVFNKITLTEEKCGRRQRPIGETRIVGGETSRLGEWPWIVALGYRRTRHTERGADFRCAGALITDQHVLTAGHCVAQERPYLARLGDLDLTETNDGASPVDIPLKATMLHPNFTTDGVVNDIAVAVLERSVNFNADIQPICLPLPSDLRFNTYVRNVLTVAGWGATYFDGPASSEMQHVPLPVITNDKCAQSYSRIRGSKIGPGNICAGYVDKKQSTCQGDSGGALMIRVNGTFYVIGITSYGVRCSEAEFPAIFTRVTHYLDWILETVK